MVFPKKHEKLRAFYSVSGKMYNETEVYGLFATLGLYHCWDVSFY